MSGERATAITTVSGVLLAVMMVLGFGMDMAIAQTTSGPPILVSDSISSELLRAKGSTIWPVEGWLYTLMVVPGFLFTLGVYRALRDRDKDLARTGFFAAALFWIFHTLHNVVMLTVIQVLVPRYASGTPQANSIEVLSIGLLGLANLIFGFGASIGGLFLAGFLFAFGLVTLESTLPRWAGYTAIAAGVCVLISYLQFISGAFMFVGLAGWVLTIVWVVGTTVALRRPSSHAQMAVNMSAG